MATSKRPAATPATPAQAARKKQRQDTQNLWSGQNDTYQALYAQKYKVAGFRPLGEPDPNFRAEDDLAGLSSAESYLFAPEKGKVYESYDASENFHVIYNADGTVDVRKKHMGLPGLMGEWAGDVAKGDPFQTMTAERRDNLRMKFIGLISDTVIIGWRGKGAIDEKKIREKIAAAERNGLKIEFDSKVRKWIDKNAALRNDDYHSDLKSTVVNGKKEGLYGAQMRLRQLHERQWAGMRSPEEVNKRTVEDTKQATEVLNNKEKVMDNGVKEQAFKDKLLGPGSPQEKVARLESEVNNLKIRSGYLDARCQKLDEQIQDAQKKIAKGDDKAADIQQSLASKIEERNALREAMAKEQNELKKRGVLVSEAIAIVTTELAALPDNDPNKAKLTELTALAKEVDDEVSNIKIPDLKAKDEAMVAKLDQLAVTQSATSTPTPGGPASS